MLRCDPALSAGNDVFVPSPVDLMRLLKATIRYSRSSSKPLFFRKCTVPRWKRESRPSFSRREFCPRFLGLSEIFAQGQNNGDDGCGGAVCVPATAVPPAFGRLPPSNAVRCTWATVKFCPDKANRRPTPPRRTAPGPDSLGAMPSWPRVWPCAHPCRTGGCRCIRKSTRSRSRKLF